jgi:hypothetical protein
MSVWAARKGGNFYYRFTVKGEVFTGTFEGCTDERAAKRLERDLREQKKAEKRLGAKAASTSSSGGRSVAAALAGYKGARERGRLQYRDLEGRKVEAQGLLRPRRSDPADPRCELRGRSGGGAKGRCPSVPQ